MTGRRERHRANTIEDIKEAALEALADQGTSGLSMRGIARTIDMSPAGLYRYYDGLDALITELIADAFNDLANAVLAASSFEGHSRDRMIEGMLAYRSWCVSHPNRFMLIFGTPIPGYSAPDEGPTVVAARRIGEVFFSIARDAWQRDTSVVPNPHRPLTEAEESFAAGIGSGFPAAGVSTGLSAWAHFHGLVTLELIGQLQWMYPDPHDFYRAEVESIADRLFAT
jgi:AcrR family transcriptional regulator